MSDTPHLPPGFHPEHRGPGFQAETGSRLVVARPAGGGRPPYVRVFDGFGGEPIDHTCGSIEQALELAAQLLAGGA